VGRIGISTAGQTRESKAQLEEASGAAKTDQCMGTASAMALEGQMSGHEPEFPEGKLAFDGALDFWRRERG
jgi:hypothetical protein